jgi:hypothetical protein
MDMALFALCQIADAREQILPRFAGALEGAPLEQFLPDPAAVSDIQTGKNAGGGRLGRARSPPGWMPKLGAGEGCRRHPCTLT